MIALRKAPPPLTNDSLEKRVRAILAELDYDWGRFELDDFLGWLGDKFQTPIRRGLVPLPAACFGGWIAATDPAAHYIFVDETLTPNHQSHIVLHEVGHWLCGHPTLVVSHVELREMVGRLLSGELTFAELWGQLRVRDARGDMDNRQEREAERFAILVREMVYRQTPDTVLVAKGSTIASMQTFFDALGVV